MKRLLHHSIVRIATVAILSFGLVASAYAGDNVCCSHQSTGNPYRCYGQGNCTWWSWKRANETWGQSMPNFGNARDWASLAQSAGYPVENEPGSLTIGVSSSYGRPHGHVVMVERLDGSNVSTTEMNYQRPPRTLPPCDRWKSHPHTRFNRGFILPQPTWDRPAVYFYTGPVRYAAPYDQSLLFFGDFFTGGMLVDARFPNGQYATLSGSQVSVNSSRSITVNVTLGSSGWWKFRFVDTRGQRSGWIWLYVN
ncbi:MAG: CHAP domain-containing protein [Acidobacteria bacterium]|nr:CHAP domain-containing protein [Acidobacteriota bacterium]